MIPGSISKDTKKEIAAVLKKAGILPDLSCQIIFHCVQGTLQTIEYGKIIIK